MKPATTIAALLLVVIAIGHLVRAVSAWTVVINGMTVPVWISGVIAVVFAVLAILVFREQRT